MSYLPATRRSRFTLIELLVVVAVIAVLAAMLLPALSRARRMAYRATCTSNLKQISLGQALYADDFDGWGPHAGAGGDGSTLSYQNDGMWEWFPGYFPDNLIFRCPTEEQPDPKFSSNRKASRGGDRWADALISSYQLTFAIGSYLGTGNYHDWWWGWRVRDGSHAPLPRYTFLDSRVSYNPPNPAPNLHTFTRTLLPADEQPVAYDGINFGRADRKYRVYVPYESDRTWWGYRTAGHELDKGNNYAYADGHVDWKIHQEIQWKGSIGLGSPTTGFYW